MFIALQRFRLLAIGALAAIVYVLAANFLARMPRNEVSKELRVALPPLVQVLMSAGDRHLAANILGFRVLVADTMKMDRDQFLVQARLQQDLSWLNPAHEDNYYIAAAILPWNDQVDTAQTILARAAAARPKDWTPMFYYAFHLYYFKKDIPGASGWMARAADRANEGDAMGLLNLSAKWAEQGYRPKNAVQVVNAIAQQSRSTPFRKYLQQRARRIAELEKLQDAEVLYRQRYGKPLERLGQLVESGLLSALPVDPFGFGYRLDASGKPILLNEAAKDK